MRLLTTLVGFLKSRDKMLIKRRKIRLKNRPMSKKRLEQQKKVMNISYETKLLEIKKQMDRKKSPNHHLNEIIEELFYPQIQLSSQKEVDLRVKQISNESTLKEQQWQSLVMMDELQEELSQNSLPLEFLQLHEEKYSQFSSKHYMILLSRLNYYCHNKTRIQQQRTQNWKKMVQKMKTKDEKLKQQVKCPYLFLQREEIPRHQFWSNLVEQIKIKMQGSETIESFNDYLPVLLLIQRTFNYMPAQLYQLAINKNSSAPFEKLSRTDISLLIKLLKSRKKIKYNANIKIESPIEDMPKQYNHAFFARKIAAQVIEHPERYTVEDLSNLFKIINTRKRRMNIISQDQFPKIQKIIETFLNDLTFQNVQTFFSIYCTFNQNPNLQFIQIIKFDLFRKAQTCKWYFYLQDLINRIRGRELLFKIYQPNGIDPKILRLEGYQLLLKLGEVITKKFDQMKSYQLIQVLDAYFDNDIKNQSLIQILSTEIVRKGSEYSLQILGKSLFKLTLLGYRSKILTKFVFQSYLQKYHQEMKKYKDEGVMLLPTEDKVSSLPMDFKQIYLQECLLMTLWSINKQLGDQLPTFIKLDQMLQLIPLKMESADPLALELTLNINSSLKPYAFFPKIVCQNTDTSHFPLGRLKEFYLHGFSKNEIQLLMESQAKKTSFFSANFNKKDGKFLKERWSQKNVYDTEQYIEFCKDKIENPSSGKGNCFFDSQLILSDIFLKRRTEIIGKMIQKKQSEKQLDNFETIIKKQKIYNLLI